MSSGWAEKQLRSTTQHTLVRAGPCRSIIILSRSGAKRVLHAADGSVPSGAHDIYDEDLIIALAKLIAGRLDVQRWRFATDSDNGKSGRAFLDVARWTSSRTSERRSASRRSWTLCGARRRGAIPTCRRWRGGSCCGRCEWPCSCTVSPRCRAKRSGSNRAEFAHLITQNGCVVEAEPANVVGRCAVHALLNDECTVRARRIVLDRRPRLLVATLSREQPPEKRWRAPRRASVMH